MNKQQSCVHHTAHTTHQQDNCDGCQLQRKENNMLVDFYERLHSIENKMGKIKEHIGTQKEADLQNKQKIEQMRMILANKPDKVIEHIKQQNSKQMGYQLASALIQRQIKVKVENQRLQGIIEKLQKEKVKLEEQKRQSQLLNSRPTMSYQMRHSQKTEKRSDFWQEVQPSRYSDSIDEIRRTKSIQSTSFPEKKQEKQTNNSYFRDLRDNKKYWQAGEDHSETSFSNFTLPPSHKDQAQKKPQKSKYEGLNLWLYQFKSQQSDHNPIKSLRKVEKRIQRREKGGEDKYGSKF